MKKTQNRNPFVKLELAIVDGLQVEGPVKLRLDMVESLQIRRADRLETYTISFENIKIKLLQDGKRLTDKELLQYFQRQANQSVNKHSNVVVEFKE